MQEIKLDLDNYGIWYEPFWATYWFKAFAFCVLFTLVAFIAFWAIKRLKRNKKNANLTISDIINAIDHLNQKVSSDNQGETYTELMLLLKQFIWIQYKIDCFSKTEIEILQFLKLKIEKIDNDFIDRLIENSILKKFAHFKMENSQVKNDLNYVMIFIKSMNQSCKSQINRSAS